jgi:hypothetical protein
MARTREQEIELVDFGPVESRDIELDDFTVSYTTFKEETDMGPILASLPTRSCQCPHFGEVRKGGGRVRYDDGREETFTAGDVIYWTPGHVPVIDAGTEVLMFSPTAELKATDAAIQAYLATLQASQQA